MQWAWNGIWGESLIIIFFNSSDVQLGSQVWEMVTSTVLSD